MTPDPEKVREANRSRPPVDNWHDDTPITERQLDVLRGDLDNRYVTRFDPAVVRKLVLSVEQARAALPDERPQDEGDGSDMQREMATEIVRMLVAPNPCRREGDVCTPHGYSLKGGDCPHALARAFLAGADPTLRKRQAERDADVRAVAALLDAIEAMRPHPAGLERRAERMRARFADRIADLRAREGGEEA